MKFIVHTNKGKMKIVANNPDAARKEAWKLAPACIIFKVKVNREKD